MKTITLNRIKSISQSNLFAATLVIISLSLIILAVEALFYFNIAHEYAW